MPVYRLLLLIMTISIFFSCLTTGKKNNYENLTQKVLGYNLFTIYKNYTYLGYVPDRDDPELLRNRLWVGKVKVNKPTGKYTISYTKEILADSNTSIHDYLDTKIAFEKFQKVNLIIEDPEEYILEKPYLLYSERDQKESQQRQYIGAVLKARKLRLEFETVQGKKVSSFSEIKQVGIELSSKVKSDENEKNLYISEEVYIGYKLVQPPKQIEFPPTEKSKNIRVLVAPFQLNSENGKDELFSTLLWEASTVAIKNIDHVITVDRDQGIVYKTGDLVRKKEYNQMNYVDLASITNADYVLTGKFTRLGNDALITAIYRNRDGEEIPTKAIDLTLKDLDKTDISDLYANWISKVVSSFNSTLKMEIESPTQNREAYQLYVKGIEMMALMDESSLKESIFYFEKAGILDSKFPHAFAGVCEASSKLVHEKFSYISHLSLRDFEIKTELMEKASKNCIKSLKLNHKLSVTYRALSYYHFTKSQNESQKVDRKKSLDYAKKALVLDSKDSLSAWLIYFIKATENKRILFEKDNEDLKFALNLNPDLMEANRILGQIYSKQGSNGEALAIEYYKKAIQKSPKYITNYLDVADIYRQQKNFDQSLKHIQLAEKINPSDYRVYTSYIRHFIQKKDFSNAEKYILKVFVEHEKKFIEINSVVEDYYSKNRQKYQQGVDLYLDILSKDNANAEFYNYFIGNLYYIHLDFFNAIPFYQKSIEIGSKNPNSDLSLKYNGIGNCYFQMRDLNKSLQFYQKALDSNKERYPSEHRNIAISYQNIANIYYMQRSYNEAENFYLKALDINEKRLGIDDPLVASNLYNLGNIYSIKREFEKAEKYFNQSLEIRLKNYDENHIDVGYSYWGLGWMYDSKNDMNKAIELYLQSMRIFLNSGRENSNEMSELHLSLSYTYKKRNELDNSLKHVLQSLEISLKLNGFNHQSVVHRTEFLFKSIQNQNQIQVAIQYFEKLKRENPKFAGWCDTRIDELKKIALQ